MLPPADYAILDHFTAMCAVVDSDFRFLYVNKAAAKHQHMPREEMIGHTVTELRSIREIDQILLHLEECLSTQKSVEFEDQLLKWKIKIEPIAEGAFIHWTRLPASKTKVQLNSNKKLLTRSMNHGYPQRPVESKDLEIEGWLESLDLRTKETKEHIMRVADATVALAKMAGVSESEMVSIRYGALLHDIGKIGIPVEILLKSDPLTVEEWNVIRKHPLYAYDLLHPVEYLRDYLSIPYSHHERWDGTGYPQGLAGDQIPLAARLFSIIEVWETLSFDCVYRKAWPHKKIMEYIQRGSGSQFDPRVVDLFIHAEKELTRLDQPQYAI